MGDLLAEMYSDWRFFHNFLSNVAMTLTKTDIELARHYVERLVPAELHGVFDAIRDEYELTIAELLAVTGEQELLGANPVLRRTLEVRDAYLAPLHYLQVELIERWRADRRERARARPGRGARAAPERQRHRRRPAQHGLAGDPSRQLVEGASSSRPRRARAPPPGRARR